MKKIEIEISDDLEQRAKMLKVRLSILIAEAVKKSLQELEEIERFKRSVAKSKLTEKDVDELTDKINEAMWKRHKAYGTPRS